MIFKHKYHYYTVILLQEPRSFVCRGCGTQRCTGFAVGSNVVFNLLDKTLKYSWKKQVRLALPNSKLHTVGGQSNTQCCNGQAALHTAMDVKHYILYVVYLH